VTKQWYIGTGTPARDGNVIVPLVDGEEAWLDILAALRGARDTIHLMFWMMHLDHELDRPAALEFQNPADREKNTLHTVLLDAQRRGVTIRIILWVPSTIPASEIDVVKLLVGVVIPNGIGSIKLAVAAPSVAFILDLRILKYGLERKFQVLIEQHPTHSIGSWHQKTVIVDGRLAYAGGMNARQNDWDSQHTVFDYRRTPHDTTGKERAKAKAARAETRYPPRHDFMTRIEGPLVMDVHNNFVSRWNQAIANKNFLSSGLAKLSAMTTPPSGAGAASGQIVRTMPRYPPTPLGETGCYEMYLRAIQNAERYIYIEDQYFRSDRIALALASACRANPKLILVVVTPPDYLAEWDEVNIAVASPSTYWTSDSFNIIKAAVPEFSLFQLQVTDTDARGDQIFLMVNTHAKVMIVDDEWYTIGSCNINERGFLYEGELNIGVNHPDDAFALRQRLWTSHLQTPCPADIVDATRLWYQHATENHKAQQAKRKPPSRVFPFVQDGPLIPATRKSWF
jgi:phosphatidylserine/phosphatidylglycerophosphate/cardiolipin synthase-like enzyme